MHNNCLYYFGQHFLVKMLDSKQLPSSVSKPIFQLFFGFKNILQFFKSNFLIFHQNLGKIVKSFQQNIMDVNNKNLMKHGVTNYNQVMSRKDNKITNVNNI
jgi:hypothetical protein